MVKHEKLTFKPSMVWENEVSKFVKSRLNGYSLNVCSGRSLIGDVKVDVEPEQSWFFDVGNRVQADMRQLPFKNETFDSVVSDPPWKLDWFKRMRPFFECVRVCKLRGLIIYNATWIPTSKAVDLEEIWVRQTARFSNVSVICVFRKTTSKYDMEGEPRRVSP